MPFTLTVIACIVSGIVSLVTFIIYVRARLADRSEPAPLSDEAAYRHKLAGLDRKEHFYQSLHFISLALFVLFGVLILIHLSAHFNHPMLNDVIFRPLIV